jgi:hypothetical protein
MANYFTYFSLVLLLKDASQQQHALALAERAAEHRFRDSEESTPADIPPEFLDVLEDWSFETEKDGDNSIWLHSDSGGIDAVCAFIQHLLQKFDPKGRVEFEWSDDCSKPRTDAYGGGAAIVTAKEIRTMNTSQWLRQQAKSNEKKTRKTKERALAEQAREE